MFRRVLIANRGEVAARVLRTLRRLGVQAVAIASEADRALGYLDEADEVVTLGGLRPYLDQDAILDAALRTRCAAVHPGWGFLSENAVFAARCEAARVTFIGPRPLSMRLMGDKALARDTMRRFGLHPIPGGEGVLSDVDHARSEAERLGYPVLLKALAGGGGRGMRIVRGPEALASAYLEASAEAAGAFGDAGLYIERYVERGRHIELQLMGDGRGAVKVLGARECSVQRRHQKLIEETPAPELAPATLAAAIAQVEAACGQLRYRGAGTVEMLQDDVGSLWFMEMNTRLQVEHTITEAVTGLDLVEWQLRVAANEGIAGLSVAGAPGGAAIECRINAEDVGANFRPTPGQVTHLRLPAGEGVRVDTHLREGDRISPHYDSMIAKLIAWGPDRPTAIARMLGALDGLEVEGVPTTAALHARILRHPTFASGAYDTRFLERELERLLS